ncbi:hypothetical protein HDU87_005456 [Geranomyces variabilis]|uniref:Large ribosomal subunit protein mL50 n=1 Tax=Geranomyces variabilis TaxID=109894 RepID=A0AAD5TGY6_9FUNG|nr:hypothetical protein HDU87_005456 [Geranomyces variabilis]
MRFMRASINISARAARRARAGTSSSSFSSASSSSARPTVLPSSFGSPLPSARFLASLGRQTVAALHTSSPALALLDAVKTTENAAETSAGASALPLGALDGSDEAENENSSRLRLESAEEIDAAVKEIVERTVTSSGQDGWESVDLTSPSLKFKIVSASMEACGTTVSNVDLTNIASVRDLLKVLKRKQDLSNPFHFVDTVEQMFKTKGHELPPNMYFSPAARGVKSS